MTKQQVLFHRLGVTIKFTLGAILITAATWIEVSMGIDAVISVRASALTGSAAVFVGFAALAGAIVDLLRWIGDHTCPQGPVTHLSLWR